MSIKVCKNPEHLETETVVDSAPTDRCSFCGRAKQVVDHMVQGPGDVRICNECVDHTTALMYPGLPEARRILAQAEAVGEAVSLRTSDEALPRRPVTVRWSPPSSGWCHGFTGDGMAIVEFEDGRVTLLKAGFINFQTTLVTRQEVERA